MFCGGVSVSHYYRRDRQAGTFEGCACGRFAFGAE